MSSPLVFIFVMALLITSFQCKKNRNKNNIASGISLNDPSTRTCEEFSKNARFNPYSVLDDLWFVFYFWGPPMGITIYKFTYPSITGRNNIQKILDGKVDPPVNWTARLVVMSDNQNMSSLLVEQNDRGHYLSYAIPTQYVLPKRLMQPVKIVLKQTADNKIVGFMVCERESVFAMSRLNEVPPTYRLLEEATRLGFQDIRGTSYLYQGHHWMPVGEADEKNFWDYRHKDISLHVKPKSLESTRMQKEQFIYGSDGQQLPSGPEAQPSSYYASREATSFNEPKEQMPHRNANAQSDSNSLKEIQLDTIAVQQKSLSYDDQQSLFGKVDDGSTTDLKNQKAEEFNVTDDLNTQNLQDEPEEYLYLPEEQPLVYHT